MNSKSFDYLSHVTEILERVKNTQWEAMDACAQKMADAIDVYKRQIIHKILKLNLLKKHLKIGKELPTSQTLL